MGLKETFTMIEKLSLLVAAVGHDLDHPGFNNAYQMNALTQLAIAYNDSSPLENHHCGILILMSNALFNSRFRGIEFFISSFAG